MGIMAFSSTEILWATTIMYYHQQLALVATNY